MNETVRVSKKLVESFWEKRLEENYKNREAVAKLYDVRHAKPEDLIPDFKAIRRILGLAIKELEGKR